MIKYFVIYIAITAVSTISFYFMAGVPFDVAIPTAAVNSIAKTVVVAFINEMWDRYFSGKPRTT